MTNFQIMKNTGPNSFNVQISIFHAEEIGLNIMKSVFGKIPEQTKIQIENNQKSFINMLKNHLDKITLSKLDTDNVVGSLDFQSIFKDTLISASKSDSEEMHEWMALLIILRINNNPDKTMYNKTLHAIKEINIDQIRIITLLYTISEFSVCAKNIKDLVKCLETALLFTSFNKTSEEVVSQLYDFKCVSDYGSAFGPGNLADFLSINCQKISMEKNEIAKILVNDGEFKVLNDLWNWPISRMSITGIGKRIATMYFLQQNLPFN